jgi:hypothetical protein
MVLLLRDKAGENKCAELAVNGGIWIVWESQKS